MLATGKRRWPMTIKLMLPGFVAERGMLLPGEAPALDAQFRELPPAPWFSPEERQRMEEVDASSQAANTKRNYLRASKGFTDWCDEQGCSSLPAHPEAVKYYLAERYDSGMKIGTVRLDASSISDAHRQAGYADPTRTYTVRKSVAGLARTNPQPPGQAKALTEAGMANRHEAPENARSRGLMDIAICSTMRDALMRRSEAADLRWSDIDVREDGTGRLLIRRSKTDQEGKGFVTYLGPAAVMDLLEIRPAEADPEDKIIGLTGNAIGHRIRAAALTSDLGDGFSGHSCRVGMAIDLARRGATIPEIMQVGRWKSAVMVARYIRAEEAATGAVARYYGRQLGVSRPGGRINGQA
jgi:integrase